MDFKKPFRWMQNNPGKTVIGATILAAAVCYGARQTVHPAGKDVYSGTINQQKVVYNEDATKMFAFSNRHQNSMTVRRGDTTITFTDYTDQNNIDTQSERSPVGYENDRLERIVIENSKLGKRVFETTAETQETLYGKHATRVLTSGSQIYNELRTIIRNDQRAYLSKDYSAVESELGKIDSKDHSKDAKQEEKKVLPAPAAVEGLRTGINAALDNFQKEAYGGAKTQ